MTDEPVILTIDKIKETLGDEASEFIDAMKVVQAIIERPQDYTGMKAIVEATRLAALRTKIGAKAQWYKTNGDKSLDNRKKKDVLMAMYASLEENIQTLKLAGRIEAQAAGILK